MRYIQGEGRGQMTLFPATIDEYVGNDNPVRVIDAFVNTLDMDKADFKALPEWIGRPGYDPKALLKLYIYGYFNKTRSSRKLMAECHRNIEVMWLLGKLRPDFRTIADFRKRHAAAMKKVFRAFVRICSELGLYAKELEVLDGSKFRAVNAKDKNLTKAKLEAKIKRAEAKLEEYLKELDQNDKQDKEPQRHTSKEIANKIKQLKEKMETYNGYLNTMKETNESQISFTDPESRLMITHSGGFEVSYNVQTVVDSGNHMVSDFEVTSACNDKEMLYQGAQMSKEALDADSSMEVVADNGYENKAEMLKCLKAGIFPHVALQKSEEACDVFLDYKKSDITSEMLSSSEPEDIARCLEAGVLPKLYEGKNINIEVVMETTQNGAGEKCFVLNGDGTSVTCPEGNSLPKVAYLKSKCVTRFRSRSACRNCKNKCTQSQFKQVDLKDGQEILYLKDLRIEYKVKIRIKPNKEKIKLRKCVVEHVFGTIKRWNDGYYTLLKGITKVRADFALSFLAYNMKRAINILGVEGLMNHLKEMGDAYSSFYLPKLRLCFEFHFAF